MNHNGLQKSVEDGSEVKGSVSYARGRSLADFADYLKRSGQPYATSENGKQVWFRDAAGELVRLPVECLLPVEPETIRALLRQRGVWAVSFLVAADDSQPANCLHYVCSDPEYDVEKLKVKNVRRDIRLGLRSLDIRLCTWDELIEKGFTADTDTAVRHGYRPPSRRVLTSMVKRYRGLPFFEVWGAWHKSDLAAWLLVMKVDDWAMINIAHSRTDLLRWCPNNALVYAATRRALVEEKRKYISYGVSSCQIDIEHTSLHRFKTRMGYEVLPRRRVFAVHPLLWPLLRPRVSSWMWERVAKLMPQIPTLRKIAGMSRLISERESAPLTWAEDKP